MPFLYLNYLIKISEVSTIEFNSKFVHMVYKLTQNHGVDYAVLSNNVSSHLSELLADEAKIIITENTDISILSSKIYFVIKIFIIY